MCPSARRQLNCKAHCQHIEPGAGFESERQAALAYDLAAIKCRGAAAVTNFDKAAYADELAARDQARPPAPLLIVPDSSRFVEPTAL